MLTVSLACNAYYDPSGRLRQEILNKRWNARLFCGWTMHLSGGSLCLVLRPHMSDLEVEHNDPDYNS
eukprot:1786762-Amphidinium_carterae.1